MFQFVNWCGGGGGDYSLPETSQNGEVLERTEQK